MSFGWWSKLDFIIYVRVCVRMWVHFYRIEAHTLCFPNIIYFISGKINFFAYHSGSYLVYFFRCVATTTDGNMVKNCPLFIRACRRLMIFPRTSFSFSLWLKLTSKLTGKPSHIITILNFSENIFHLFVLHLF